MRKVNITLAVVLLSAFIIQNSAFPQQPSSQAPIYKVNAAYTNGVAPGFAPSAGSGLTLNLSAGSAFCGYWAIIENATTLTMAASATNYVYLDTANSCAPATNTGGFYSLVNSSDPVVAIAVVTTSGSAITNIQDDRTYFALPAWSGGSGGSMTWPNAAGIANYTGSSAWGTSYNASNLIPSNFIPTLNQNTTGTAAALAGTPTLCNAGYSAGGIVASGNATQCTVLASTAGVVSHKWLASYNASTGAFTQSQPASTDLSDYSSMNAATATALAGTPTLCSTGYAPTGILANGNATGCANLGSGGGMVYPGAGIANSSGSAWGTSYSATNPIPANFLSLSAYAPLASPTFTGTVTIPNGAAIGTPASINLANATFPTTIASNTTGNAATATALAGSPSQCGTSQFSTGIAANGSANCSIVGFVSRDVSGTSDTVAATDHTAGIVFTGSTNATEALPTATTLGYANFWTQITNAMSGAANTVTVNATSWQIYPAGGSSGASSLTINNGQSCWIYVDAAGSAWDAVCHEGQLSAGTLIGLTRAASGITINFTGTMPVTITNPGHNFLTAYTSSTGAFSQARPACADLSDASAMCNSAAYSSLTGTPTLAQTIASASHKWLSSYTASTGLFTQTQPASSDLSDYGSFPGAAFGSQTQNYVYASPNGSSGNPGFRALVGADLPVPSSSTLGGIESLALVSHKFISAISTSGVPSATQPASTDLSDYGSFPGAAFGSQTQNYFYAAPNGSNGNPSFRAIVAADIPTLNQNTTGTAAGLTSYPTLCSGGQFSQGLSSGSNNCATPSGGSFSPTTFQSSAVTTNISATNIISSMTSSKLVHLDWEVSLTVVGASCTGSTTVTVNAIFTDPNTSSTNTEALGTVTLASLGNGTVGFIAEGSDVIYAKTGTAVQYSTSGYTAGAGCGTNPTYQVTGQVF